LRVSPAKL